MFSFLIINIKSNKIMIVLQKLIYLRLNLLLSLFSIYYNKDMIKLKLLFYVCIWDKFLKLENKLAQLKIYKI